VKSFWPTYLFLALAGSAAINFGVPKLRRDGLQPRPGSAPASIRFIEPPPSATPQPAQPAEVVMEPELAPAPFDPARSSLPAPSTPAPGPNTPGARTSGWGITTTQTTHYEPNGTRLGRLPGGTLIEVKGSASSSLGNMTICRYRQNDFWTGPVLVNPSQLAFFSGDMADLPAESLEALQRYFETKGLIETRKAELQRQQVDANPHAAPYRQAYEQLTAMQERAKILTAERDNATDDARNRIIDELRRMKDEQSHLRDVYNQAQAQYRSWKAQHAADRTADPSADPQIQAWERRLATLEPEVRKILPVP
jgi:hypothetical protein